VPDPENTENASISKPAATLPDIEELADSEDANVIEARAKLLKAQAGLMRAHQPLFDKLVLRGLIPIAIAIVGPWAAWKFTVKTDELNQKAQSAETAALESQEITKELQALLKTQQQESVERRKRLQRLEERKAAELVAMSQMVIRLDDTLKNALVQMIFMKEIAEHENLADGPHSPLPPKEEIIGNIAAQMQLPGIDSKEIRKLAGKAYDRYEKNEGKMRRPDSP